jgi:hypothetical protein
VVPYEPIPPSPEPNPGQRPEGCRHIHADVDPGQWRYCQRPIQRGAWCAAHYAAARLWPGFSYRQRTGEILIRMLTVEDLDAAA